MIKRRVTTLVTISVHSDKYLVTSWAILVKFSEMLERFREIQEIICHKKKWSDHEWCDTNVQYNKLMSMSLYEIMSRSMIIDFPQKKMVLLFSIVFGWYPIKKSKKKSSTVRLERMFSWKSIVHPILDKPCNRWSHYVDPNKNSTNFYFQFSDAHYSFVMFV